MKSQPQIDAWHRLYPKMPDRAKRYLQSLSELGTATNREVAKHLGSDAPSDWTSARAWLQAKHIIGEAGSKWCSISKERVTAYRVSEHREAPTEVPVTSSQSRQYLVEIKRTAIWLRDAGIQDAATVIQWADRKLGDPQ